MCLPSRAGHIVYLSRILCLIAITRKRIELNWVWPWDHNLDPIHGQWLRICITHLARSGGDLLTCKLLPVDFLPAEHHMRPDFNALSLIRFTLLIYVLFLPFRCADGYMGPRCEYKNLDGTYLRKCQSPSLLLIHISHVSPSDTIN